MKCDTCGRETRLIKRVVIYKDYDKSNARPVYNCQECFEKKEKAKPYYQKKTGKDA